MISGLPATDWLRRRVVLTRKQGGSATGHRPIHATLKQVGSKLALVIPNGHKRAELVPYSCIKGLFAESPDLKAKLEKMGMPADDDDNVILSPEPEQDTVQPLTGETSEPVSTSQAPIPVEPPPSPPSTPRQLELLAMSDRLIPQLPQGSLLFTGNHINQDTRSARADFENLYNDMLRNRAGVVEFVAEFLEQLENLRQVTMFLENVGHWSPVATEAARVPAEPAKPAATSKPNTIQVPGKKARRRKYATRVSKLPISTLPKSEQMEYVNQFGCSAMSRFYNTLRMYAQDAQSWDNIPEMIAWVNKELGAIGVEPVTPAGSTLHSTLRIYLLSVPNTRVSRGEVTDKLVQAWRPLLLRYLQFEPIKIVGGNGHSVTDYKVTLRRWHAGVNMPVVTGGDPDDV